MLRFFILLLVIYGIVRLWRRSQMVRTYVQERRQQHEVTHEIAGEMVSCSQCGTFVLKSEALIAHNDPFCSSKCKENHQ